MFMDRLTGQVEYPVVDTPDGSLMGLRKGNVSIFRGIPYATARRFHFPEPVSIWDGVRDALAYGPACPELNTDISPAGYLIPSYYMPQDEHCQTLNIWTCSPDSNAKKPVMIWIHGGGWVTGSSVEQYAYDGESLAEFGDVVLVSLNHRLNVLGALDLSAFGGEYARSGMCGLADLVEALRWVKKNIACFGGDPGNVTLFGQSGGGSKILSLMQTPAADGLYHKVVLQSGGNRYAKSDGTVTEKELQVQLGERVVQKLGLDAGSIAQIETVPYWFLAEAAKAAAEKLAAEVGNSGVLTRWEPACDGEYALPNPLEAGFREETRGIPMLVMSVLGEHFVNRFGGKDLLSAEERMAVLAETYGEDAQAVADAFRDAYPSHNVADAAYMDVESRAGLLRLCQKRLPFGTVYNAVFSLDFPIRGGYTPWHCADIPYVFHNAQYCEPEYIPGISERLQDAMSGAWTAFARTGNPSHDAIPAWPALSAKETATMIFDETITVGIDHDRKLLELLRNRRR